MTAATKQTTTTFNTVFQGETFNGVAGWYYFRGDTGVIVRDVNAPLVEQRRSTSLEYWGANAKPIHITSIHLPKLASNPLIKDSNGDVLIQLDAGVLVEVL